MCEPEKKNPKNFVQRMCNIHFVAVKSQKTHLTVSFEIADKLAQWVEMDRSYNIGFRVEIERCQCCIRSHCGQKENTGSTQRRKASLRN